MMGQPGSLPLAEGGGTLLGGNRASEAPLSSTSLIPPWRSMWREGKALGARLSAEGVCGKGVLPTCRSLRAPPSLRLLAAQSLHPHPWLLPLPRSRLIQSVFGEKREETGVGPG